MKTITVNASCKYNIYIERGLIKNCVKIISDTLKTRRIAVITDDIVNDLYHKTVEKSLTEYGF